MAKSEKQRDILDIMGTPETPSTSERPVVTPTERQNFLSEFLDGGSDANGANDPEAGTDNPEPDINGAQSEEAKALQQRVVETLREIYDPEIPVNIYDMGLIYGVAVDENMAVTITMTLTTPHCPVAETMPGEVELRASATPGAMGAEVKLVWDPPWDMSRMSDEARLELGLL